MKIKLSIIISSFIASTSLYAGWNQQCLDDCFSTKHDCGYCAWQCETNDNGPPQRVHAEFRCPLQGYENNY